MADSYADLPIFQGGPPPSSRPQHRRRDLSGALALLLEQTAARVAAGARARGTLTMQHQHARWLTGQLGGRLPVERIDERMLERFASAAQERGGRLGQGLNPRTVQKAFTTLRGALRCARRERWIDRLPTFPEWAFPPRAPRPVVFTSGDDFWRLFGALRPHRADWMALAFFTAQHASDVERMTWSDVDLDGPGPSMLVRNTKNRRAGLRVAMPRPLVAILRLRRRRVRPAPADRIVPAWQNRAIDLARACVRVGLPPTDANGLRHAATTAMVRNRGITVAAQRWGGWASTALMERVYAHVLPAQLIEIANELASFVDPAGDQ